MAKSFVRKFIFDKLPIHGAYVELTDVWHTILSQKEYPEGIKRLLGELLVSNVLLTTNIKLEGKIIAQIQDNPKLDLAVSECSNNLKVRATAKFANSAYQDNQISYTDCIEAGALVISIDSNADGKLYQSVVGLNGYNLEEILTEYMLQSQQLRSIFLIAYSESKVAGFMLQQLPDKGGIMTDDIDRVFFLAETLKHSELLHDEIGIILKRLFDEDDVILYDPHLVEFSCTCSRERVSNMLRSLGKNEALGIIADEGLIKVTCDFCNTVYSFDNQNVEDMFNTLCVDIECVSQEVH
jgi:molecular chaperone Hsp33